MTTTSKNQIIKLVVSLLICQGAGFIGSLATRPAIAAWYQFLEKPAFSPPNWLFGPVWLTLYLLMGISLFLVWRKGLDFNNVKISVIIFIVQLIINALWSVFFFGLRSPLLGFIVILILWLAILMTVLNFNKVSKPASILLIPYLIWVSFAAILNYSIMILNP